MAMDQFQNISRSSDEGNETNLRDFGMEKMSFSQNSTVLSPKASLMVVQLLFDLPNVFLVMTGPIAAFTSLACNSLVLGAIFKIPTRALKPKVLLINALLVDVLFPVSYCFTAVVYSAVALGMPNNYQRACLDGMKAIFEPITQYVQTMSSLVLALDRLYAIITPFHYRINAYAKRASLSIVATTWIVSTTLTIPVFFSDEENGDEAGVCYRLAEGHKNWNNTTRFFVVIGLSVITFCCYGLLFGLVKLRPKSIRKSGKTNRNESISLAITFFCVHLSVLCFFIPGPLFAILNNLGYLQLAFADMWKIRRCLIFVYMINSIVDPLLVATRIPVIKLQVDSLLKKK